MVKAGQFLAASLLVSGIPSDQYEDMTMHSHSNPARRVPDHPLDVLKGAAAIAEFLFGTKRRRREVYYLVERNGLPHFKMGTMICARTSTIMAWIADQESQVGL